MKYFLLILVCVAGVGLYLNRSYSHIYQFMHEHSLVNPSTAVVFSIPAPTVSSTTAHLTYVALGDSLTAGVGANAPEESYPYQAATLLAKQKNVSIDLYNLGIPGATAAEVLRQLPEKLKPQPDIITLLVGVNDIHARTPLPEFKQTVTALVDHLPKPTRKVYVLTIPYVGSPQLFWPPYQWYFNWQTKRYNAALREALQGKNVTFVDIYTPGLERSLTESSFYSADLFHPAVSGYALWGSLLYDDFHY